MFHDMFHDGFVDDAFGFHSESEPCPDCPDSCRPGRYCAEADWAGPGWEAERPRCGDPLCGDPGCRPRSSAGGRGPRSARDSLAAMDDAARRVAAAVAGVIGAAYERGWQPLDLLHVVQREQRLPQTGAVAALILAEAHATVAWERAPREWVAQLEAMARADPAADTAACRYARFMPTAAEPGPAGYDDDRPWLHASGPGSPVAVCARLTPVLPPLELHGWRRLSGRSGVDLHLDRIVFTWLWLPRWPQLCPPPSAWPDRASSAGGAGGDEAVPGPRAGDGTTADAKILDRIRGLLAKAESTDFPDEAEALAAKAQELMTRYAVDSALLDAGAGPGTHVLSGRRIHLHNPYLHEQVQLLGRIASANTVRVVWSKPYAIATIIGAEAELAHVELLFTSLLLQGTRMMHAAPDTGGGPSRKTGFRRSFLMGFATRIGQRLEEAKDTATREAAAQARVTEHDLLPALRAKQAAVDAETDRLFPHTRSSSRTAGVDATGWVAGSDAAERATITAGGPRITGTRALPGRPASHAG